MCLLQLRSVIIKCLHCTVLYVGPKLLIYVLDFDFPGLVPSNLSMGFKVYPFV